MNVQFAKVNIKSSIACLQFFVVSTLNYRNRTLSISLIAFLTFSFLFVFFFLKRSFKDYVIKRRMGSGNEQSKVIYLSRRTVLDPNYVESINNLTYHNQ